VEPRIQYAKTKDGVSIAFWVVGHGPPFVWLPEPPWSHIQVEWRVPPYQKSFNYLATKRSVVRFDARGLGLSDRDVEDLSLDSRILDLEAVVDSLGYETIALGAVTFATPLAIAYAARYPERVSQLALVSPIAGGMDAKRVPRWQTLQNLLDSDWELFLENLGALNYGLGREEARKWADLRRACVSQGTARRYYDTMDGDDVTEHLPHVSAPTLLVHLTGLSLHSIDSARKLAATIPNAQMVALEGDYLESTGLAAAAVDQFLAEREEEGKTLAPEDVHTILFTDVEGSTALTQRLGDAKARTVLREHERIVREALKSHGGSELKTMGDGFMASFSSAVRALESAIAMQRAFAAHNQSAQEAILVRIGMNAGEPIAEDDPDGRSDLHGTAVIRAARIAALAKGGEILVANVVRELAEGKEFLFSDRGETTLRGFDDPVRLFELRWQEED
jgi:class 3 adenylate cyclase